MKDSIPESWARAIMQRAMEEGRCAETLECLFDGGSVTIDAMTGQLCLINAAQLDALTTNSGE